MLAFCRGQSLELPIDSFLLHGLFGGLFVQFRDPLLHLPGRFSVLLLSHFELGFLAGKYVLLLIKIALLLIKSASVGIELPTGFSEILFEQELTLLFGGPCFQLLRLEGLLLL
jgi:hypothetical protein